MKELKFCGWCGVILGEEGDQLEDKCGNCGAPTSHAVKGKFNDDAALKLLNPTEYQVEEQGDVR